VQWQCAAAELGITTDDAQLRVAARLLLTNTARCYACVSSLLLLLLLLLLHPIWSRSRRLLTMRHAFCSTPRWQLQGATDSRLS
jgi:hypothetical protein